MNVSLRILILEFITFDLVLQNDLSFSGCTLNCDTLTPLGVVSSSVVVQSKKKIERFFFVHVHVHGTLAV